MILKEVDEIATQDKYQKAGLSAEKQMAFYLKRAFEAEENVLVINTLRLEKNGDAAQVDHLILHEYGMIIIESKSVSTKVAVNEYGEWARSVDGVAQGMPSPVKQGQRQAEFLKRYLIPHTESLLKKVAGIQLKFDKMPIDIIVAISDQGIIARPKTKIDDLDYIRKADQVVDKIKQVIAGYKKEERILSLSLGPYYLGKTARTNVSRFLLKEHRLFAGGGVPKVMIKQTAPQVTPQIDTEPIIKFWMKCGKCHGKNVEVAYGKYGYYINCKECQQNTAIREVCTTCKEKLRVRKEKDSFFFDCSKCGTSQFFHKNIHITNN